MSNPGGREGERGGGGGGAERGADAVDFDVEEEEGVEGLVGACLFFLLIWSTGSKRREGS
eukprot:1608950-Rhodomonas_salina.6